MLILLMLNKKYSYKDKYTYIRTVCNKIVQRYCLYA